MYDRFYNRDDARDALNDQDGRMYDGRRITIEWYVSLSFSNKK